MAPPHTHHTIPSDANTQLPNVFEFLATALPCKTQLRALSPSARQSTLSSLVNQLTEAFLLDITNSLQQPTQTPSPPQPTHRTHHQTPPSHQIEEIVLSNQLRLTETHSDTTLTDPIVPTDPDGKSSTPTPASTPAPPNVNTMHGKPSRKASNNAKTDTSKPLKSLANNPTPATPTLSNSLPQNASPPHTQLVPSLSETQTTATTKGHTSLSANNAHARKRKRNANDTDDHPTKKSRSADTPSDTPSPAHSLPMPDTTPPPATLPTSDNLLPSATIPHSDTMPSSAPAPSSANSHASDQDELCFEFYAAPHPFSIAEFSDHTIYSSPAEHVPPHAQSTLSVPPQSGVRIAPPSPQQNPSWLN